MDMPIDLTKKDPKLAVEDLDEDLEEEVEDESEEESEDEDATEGADTDGGEPDAKAPKSKQTETGEKLVPQARVDAIVQDRLAKAERKHQKALEDAKNETKAEFFRHAGANIPEADVKQALQLWSYLKANPKHSQAINGFLEKNPWETHPKFDDKKSDEVDLRAEFDRKLELRDTVSELRADPTFKKYESRVREYAEDEGFDPTSPKELKKAYKAWRGENARLLAASARLEGQREAATAKKTAATARLQSTTGPRGSRAVDPRKLSDSEFLRREGLTLFTDSE